MEIQNKELVRGAWWQYKLECPFCHYRMNVSCPRGDEEVIRENPCPNKCGKVKEEKDGLDKRIVRKPTPKRSSSKTRKRTTRKNKT